MKVTKLFYLSKTFWFNILAVLVVIANYFGYADFELDETIITLVVALVNLFLRWVTKEGITWASKS